jgi:serine/threonine-protein kinase
MAAVYVAIDQVSNQRLALKILHPNLLDNAEVLGRFEREARATMRIKHPNLVQAFGHGEHGEGFRYMVLEFLEGPTLEDYAHERGPLPTSEVVQIGSAVAAALGELHKRGVIHRDLKPSNIILQGGDPGAVKVFDLGLALHSSLTRVTSVGMRIGTPAFMAPEYIEESRCDARSDLYSLGAILFELASGTRVFQGSGRDVLFQQVETEAPLLEERASGLHPDGLSVLLGRMLRKDPHERPQHAQEVIEALQAL